MCGIAGIVDFDGRPVARARVARMCELLRHRGPDGQGIYLNRDGMAGRNGPRVGLGHRRLKIVDLSDSARQPMTNPDGSLWLTYNGEIYNHVTLREMLVAKGYRFASAGDAEVVLHAYEAWGERCVDRFDGMWALAVWDAREQSLFLSRDRLGIKPLYYLANGDELLFASEIKALIAVTPARRDVDFGSVARYLFDGKTDRGADTFFAAVKALPAGHSMRVSREGRRRVFRYWDLARAAGRTDRFERTGVSMDEAAPARLRSLLDDAVRTHLFADVPVGACLSGGIDSSAIVGLASKHHSVLKTFTATFPGYACDEQLYAAQVGRACGVEAYWVRPGAQDFMALLPRMIYHQDEPCQAYGMFGQWQVMAHAARKVKVVLDGQGGDELFGGYLHYFPHYLKTLAEDSSVDRNRRLAVRSRIADCFGRTAARPFAANANGAFAARTAILSDDLKACLTYHDDSGAKPFDDHLTNVLFHAVTRDSLPSLLRCEDRMSMAHSVEARVPFLDHRLVAFGFALPYDLKISGEVTKVVLRQAMRGIVPDGICNRKDKLGFEAPLAIWLRNELAGPVKAILLSDRLKNRNLIQRQLLQQKLADHCAQAADHTWEIWRWLSLEIWFREFIDQPIRATDQGGRPWH